jgi:GNAT superfamily N-acetyltransferase/acetolactate synthase regulatory subunit
VAKESAGTKKSGRAGAEASRAAGRLAGDLVRIIDELPFPPVAEAIRQQAADPSTSALQTVMSAARQALSSPAATWDEREIQAIALAPVDAELLASVQRRLDQRWAGVLEVVRQLRGSGRVDPTVDDSAAALHLMSVGLGISMLTRISPRLDDPQGWTALTARLLEALAAIDPDVKQVDVQVSTWRGRVAIAGQPTALARLLRVLSLLDVQVVSMFTAVIDSGEQLVDLIMRAPASVDRHTLIQAMDSVGRDVIVGRGERQDVEDVATRVLNRCSELVRDPDAAPQAAADLVLADSWEVTDAAVGADDSATVLRLQWTLERHVVLRRRNAPFTRTEFSRASALLGLVAALSELRGTASGYGWSERLDDGSDVWIRLARPHDTAAVAAMHERCSPESRYHRYFTPMDTWREENLRRISGGHRGATLVATVGEAEVVALGNVFPAGEEGASSAEIAVIVDDAWQRRGLGHRMLEHLIDVARQLGFASVTAYVLAENGGMLRLLESLDLDWTHRVDHDLGASVVCLEADIT